MDKHCQQQLQKFGLTQADITHVCIAPGLFPLLQYLLAMDDDVVFKHTYYFVSEIIPEETRQKLPCSCFDYYGKSLIRQICRRFDKIKLRLCKYRDYPFLRSAELFAYDIPYLSMCIGERPYSLLSDAPNWLNLNMQPTSEVYIRQQKVAASLLGRVQRWVYGDLFVHYLGNNKQCKAVYLTEENKSPVLEGKSVYVQPLEMLYDKSSEKKRQFIKKLFNIQEEDIALLNQYPNIVFSQPLLQDCGLTEDEYVQVLEKIFKHYPKGSIVIKTHPRDTFDYQKYFSGIAVFTKSINSQLLYLAGVRPQRIITVSSTAIEGFPETIECDYYGNSIHQKVEAYLGSNFKSNRKVNYITD
jgi:hypothetical protein